MPLRPGPPRPTAFLDRDDVLNIDPGYVYRPEHFEWITGAVRTVQELKEAGWWVVVVTNQSGVERGIFTEADLLDLSQWMLEQAPFDAVYYCPHHPEAGCPARKPGDGMFRAAANDFPIDRERSFLIGDRSTDIEAAQAFGLPGHLFTGGDLWEFVQKIRY